MCVRNSSRVSSLSPTLRSTGVSALLVPEAADGAPVACIHTTLMGLMAVSACFSCITSRGITLPVATRDTMRSMSPMRRSSSSITSRLSGSRKK